MGKVRNSFKAKVEVCVEWGGGKWLRERAGTKEKEKASLGARPGMREARLVDLQLAANQAGDSNQASAEQAESPGLGYHDIGVATRNVG